MGRDLLVNHLEEIFGRHVRRQSLCLAVAATMQAVEVATQGTLPKELPQRMQLLVVLAKLTFEFEPNLLFQRENRHLLLVNFHFHAVLLNRVLELDRTHAVHTLKFPSDRVSSGGINGGRIFLNGISGHTIHARLEPAGRESQHGERRHEHLARPHQPICFQSFHHAIYNLTIYNVLT